ncbi:MAG TPA: UDP-N-acetylmuramoyl-tripeptide--D-alanyl-D-alanine ligase, partial [Candidatus Binataceae bacterium]|nr:UDP-N-acetylmuramoyl-tripeptide--D-alanyl-D-alanine ligase [Candidatus Binataceae bacterium]
PSPPIMRDSSRSDRDDPACGFVHNDGAMATPIPENRCIFTLGEIADATGGLLEANLDKVVRGVSIDTRTISRGALFVPLKGAGRDGHDFLDAALRAGAGAAIVEHGRKAAGIDCIEVEDTLAALGSLARAHLRRIRSRTAMPVIAVGGAAGKTTTKEITAAVARAIFGAALSTPGNLNNLIGVPMTIFTIAEEHRAAVIECGTNTRGEIPRLAAIVEPDVAMVLNVDIEHSEGLGTLEEIADEEAAIFATTRRFAVVPADEPMSASMLARRVPKNRRAITFGESEKADVRLIERSMTAGGRARIAIEIDAALVNAEPIRIESEIALIGRAAALNCTAALAANFAAASAFGVKIDQPRIQGVERALASVEAVTGRLAILQSGKIFIIDDTYNANPRSVRAALEAAREIATSRNARLVVAMGDMLELGAISAAAHDEALSDIESAHPAAVIVVGPEMTAAVKRRAASDIATHRFVTAPDSVEAAKALRDLLRPGDVFLIKGSRGIAMERILEAIESPQRAIQC